MISEESDGKIRKYVNVVRWSLDYDNFRFLEFHMRLPDGRIAKWSQNVPEDLVVERIRSFYGFEDSKTL